MKKVEAILLAWKLDDVLEAIRAVGSYGTVVTEIRRTFGDAEVHRRYFEKWDLIPAMKVEVVVPDEIVPRIVAAIRESGREERSKYLGKIFVSSVEGVWQIKGDERDENALD